MIFSGAPPAAMWAAVSCTRLPLPIVQLSIQAGFPSPADDFAVKRHDLNELLVTHPLATFLWRVSGKSMVEAGIDDGDILVVNRALTPEHRSIVVAQVDGDFTVKYLHKRGGRIKLVAGNPTFPDILFKDEQTLTICGVVTCTIKRFVGVGRSGPVGKDRVDSLHEHSGARGLAQVCFVAHSGERCRALVERGMKERWRRWKSPGHSAVVWPTSIPEIPGMGNVEHHRTRMVRSCQAPDPLAHCTP